MNAYEGVQAAARERAQLTKEARAIVLNRVLVAARTPWLVQTDAMRRVRRVARVVGVSEAEAERIAGGRTRGRWSRSSLPRVRRARPRKAR